MSLNAIIVDDEEYARQSLYFLIGEYCPDVRVTGIASSVSEARKLLKAARIDLVFLDIAMPVEDGFNLLPDLKKNLISVIFTTAFNQYAIRAIKASALDYLLKPIDIQELKDSIRKASEFKYRLDDSRISSDNDALFNSLEENLNEFRKIRKINLPHTNGFHVLNTNDILYILADSNYSVFYLEGGGKIIASKHLKEYENILDDGDFCRIHKSTMINLRHLISYSNRNGLSVRMSDNTVHTVSRRRSSEFIETVKGIFKK